MNSSSLLSKLTSLIEPLEARIAPAGLLNENGFTSVASGSTLLLEAGKGLSTSGPFGGSYLLYVQEGQALVFTTDLNNNQRVDFNEITGISAGDGLRLISFVDINGDIVTNLNADGTLSDSDNNPANGRDGRVLLNSAIKSIELRSVTEADLDTTTQPDNIPSNRIALSSYSIHGNIYAGKGFGIVGGGLTIDTSGNDIQQATFTTSGETNEYAISGAVPSIGSIKVGTAASGENFRFNLKPGATTGLTDALSDVQGTLLPFVPVSGQIGGDIIGVRGATADTAFSLGVLQAGNGGFGARGGNVQNVVVNGDIGGYQVIAGDGGRGLSGGAGGSVLNFSDLGSNTSFVFIHAGSGGQGLTGAGGAGGALQLGTMNLAANLVLDLGDGGDGFTAGGAGRSLTSAQLVVPNFLLGSGNTFVATTRNLDTAALPAPGTPVPPAFYGADPSIGQTQGIDFDRDGFGDAVLSTSNPDQLMVLFGNGLGSFDETRTIFLDGPPNAVAVAVGDFNNDGHSDIVAASASTSSFSGINVYLSKYVDNDTDGTPETLVGFTDPLRSALPVLNGVGPLLGDINYFRSAVSVERIAVGDFDGDQVNDIGVLATYQRILPGGGAEDHTIALFMDGDVDATGNGTGYFFANFGNTQAPTIRPYYGPTATGLAKNGLLKVTAMSTAATNDVLLYAAPGAGSPNNAVVRLDNSTPALAGPAATSFSLGSVDQNRSIVGTGENAQVTATVQDFTVLDFGADNDADLVVLTKAPSAFFVTFSGDGTNFTKASGTGSQAGLSIGTRDGDAAGRDIDLGNMNAFAIVTADIDGDGAFDEVAVENALGSGVVVEEIGFTTLNDLDPANPSQGVGGVAKTSTTGGQGNFDGYVYNLTVAATPTNYGVLLIPGFPNGFLGVDGDGVFDTVFYNQYGIDVRAGDGGDGAIGRGGGGGGIGGVLKTTGTFSDIRDGTTTNAVTGAVSIVLPTGGAPVQFFGGDGGNGFSGGGVGGAVAGISVTFDGTATTLGGSVSLFGGNGGFAVTGIGGAGGSLFNNHISRGGAFAAGDGGRGAIGGAGGSIVGNGVANLFDASAAGGIMVLAAGDGGNGLRGGGAGGGIFRFSSLFGQTTGAVGGSLTFTAGDGGDTVVGTGGAGGSIISSSPSTVENVISTDLTVIAGDGGNGSRGGSGGRILNFINKPTISDTPDAITVFGGNGGNGTTGPGGAGGTVQNADVNGQGFEVGGVVKFARVAAGRGGDSAGSFGGVGGSLVNVVATAGSGAMVGAAGAGGDGLVAGGTGGSLINVTLNSAGNVGAGSAIGKVLAIAGDGGDALASVPFNRANPALAPTDLDILKAYGGRPGRAGNGGSIINFLQPVSLNTNVDLIAGNGGDTPNYGRSDDIRTNVGAGGSITGRTVVNANGARLANINGNLGNSDPNVAIKAYNNIGGDYHADISMQEFVDVIVRAPLAVFPLTDALGNVGLVAGAAGRVRDANGDGALEGATAGRNGSVNNLVFNTTSSIMSMVAGNVDQIARITTISNIRLASGGLPASAAVGADKAVAASPAVPPPALGQLDYFDAAGNNVQTAPQPGFGLIDGAIFVTRNLAGLSGPRVFPAV